MLNCLAILIKLISTWQIENALAKLQNKLPTDEKIRYHDLHHSFRYHYLLKGGNMYALDQIFNHKQIDLTIGFYGRLKASDIKTVSPYQF